MNLTKTTAGYSVQLRLGANRRNNFAIHTHDEPLAQARAERMAQCARKLVSSGRLVEAYDSLRMLGEAESDEAFEVVVEAITQLCAEPIRVRHGERLITWGELAQDWLDGKIAESYPDYVRRRTPKSMKGDAGRVKHLQTVIGNVPLAAFTKDDAKRAMASLPKTTRAQNTRKAYALVIQRVINLAVSPCAIIKSSPLGDSFTPLTGKQPDLAFLYPDEDAQLLACTDVTFRERLVFGCADRLGLRAEALLALTWRHLDLKRGHVRQIGKGGKWVHFEMTHGVWETLKILREQRADEPDTARVFVQYDPSSWSRRLRAALQKAKVDRPQLFERGDGCMPIRFHDLRASFITVALANDRSEMWIRQRSGHTSSQMIARYTRPIVDTLDMRDWLPLHVALGLTEPKGGTTQPLDSAAPVEPTQEDTRRPPAEPASTDDGEPEAAHHQGQREVTAHLPTPPASEVNHVRHGLQPGRSQAGALDGADLTAERPDEAPITLGSGEVDEFLESLDAEEELGASSHGAPNSAETALPGVARRVAAGSTGSDVSSSRSTVFSAVSARATSRDRIGDPRITNSFLERASQYDGCTKPSSSARERASLHESTHGLPPVELLLDEGDLATLLGLATEARRYALVAKLGAQLDLLTAYQAQATEGQKGTG